MIVRAWSATQNNNHSVSSSIARGRCPVVKGEFSTNVGSEVEECAGRAEHIAVVSRGSTSRERCPQTSSHREVHNLMRLLERKVHMIAVTFALAVPTDQESCPCSRHANAGDMRWCFEVASQNRRRRTEGLWWSIQTARMWPKRTGQVPSLQVCTHHCECWKLRVIFEKECTAVQCNLWLETFGDSGSVVNDVWVRLSVVNICQ